jgi:NADH-quinone oxidoreductase subunit L
MVAALGAGGTAAGFFHLTTHAAFKALLFLSAGSVIHAVHSNDLRDMGGLFGKMRLTSFTFIAGALALAGFPGTSGFFSKDLVLEAVAERGALLPLAALLVAAFLTAVYVGRVVILAFFGTPSHAAEHAHESGPSMAGPLLFLTVPALILGYAAEPLTALYGEPAHFHWSTVGITASVLALSGLATAWLVFGPARALAGPVAALAPIAAIARSGAVDKLFLAAYRQGLGTVSAAAAWLDRYVVDGVINAIAYGTLELGNRARRIQTGDVRDYVYAVAMGGVLLVLMGLANGRAW